MNYKNFMLTMTRCDRETRELTQEYHNLQAIQENAINRNYAYITDKRNGLVYDSVWIKSRLKTIESKLKELEVLVNNL